MSSNPVDFKQLSQNIEGVFNIILKMWELAHIMNNSTSRTDKKQQLRYSMDQLNVHKLGLIHIQDNVLKLIGGDNDAATSNKGE